MNPRIMSKELLWKNALFVKIKLCTIIFFVLIVMQKKIKTLDAHMKNRINSLSFFSSLIILIGMIAIYFYIKSDLFVLLLGFFLFYLTFIYTRRKLFNNELNKANPVWTKSNYY